ncbi:hypothetical protein JW898_00400 [Candidatus Woesearchaeota archaeon]|nr:hypothetical protein [Candidatus Woesearchaeota archaeon]
MFIQPTEKAPSQTEQTAEEPAEQPADEAAEELPEEMPAEAEPEEADETEAAVKNPEETIVEPVRKPAKYTTPAKEPSTEKKDTCGCSFTWDPLCSNEGKIYINKCLFKCFGGDEEDIKLNSQCLKKTSPINLYTGDTEAKYEADKWNGGYCWRMMWRESGIRYCRNLIVNGRVNVEPEPLRGNWLDEEHLTADWKAREDSNTIKLQTGQKATNEEYDTTFQPLFEAGRYRFSFWARQDVAANNDWKARLILKDWWDAKPRPVGVMGCYEVSTDINADEIYIEVLPNKWRRYNYEFDVPLNTTQWTSSTRVSADCEYEWDNVPGGYRIELTGPTVGYALFDDFVLEKIN